MTEIPVPIAIISQVFYTFLPLSPETGLRGGGEMMLLPRGGDTSITFWDNEPKRELKGKNV